ncbi:MAG: hemerythrin domain-containing protein [Sedimenticola sp.]
MKIAPWRIEWSDELSMSNSGIDAEHQNFIRLVNELNDEIMSQERDKGVVEHIMNLILKDAVAHFLHEERLFVENNYPATLEHTQIHLVLIAKFKKALEEIQNTDFSKEWIDIGLDIKDLLVDHVLSEDTKYIEYLRTE